MNDLDARVRYLERTVARLDREAARQDDGLAMAGLLRSIRGTNTGDPPTLPDRGLPVDRVPVPCCAVPVPKTLTVRSPGGQTTTITNPGNGSTQWTGILTVPELVIGDFSCQPTLFGPAQITIGLTCSGSAGWRLGLSAHACGAPPLRPRIELPGFPGAVIALSPYVPNSSSLCNPFNLVFNVASANLPNWNQPSPGQWIAHE